MGVIEGRQGPDALEFLGPDLDLAKPFGVVEMLSACMRQGRKP